MDSTRQRMIAVAVFVCMFAVGMAALLNYFKYRSTAERIVKTRLVVIGKSIANSVHASLSMGLSFSDLDTLPGLIERETATHDLILGINVFDTTGRRLYSTDQLRASRNVPDSWLQAARRAGDAEWFVQQGSDHAAGISIKNNFGLTVGYLAMRYAQEEIDGAARAVLKDLALAALGVFLIAAALASVALILLMRRLDRQIHSVEALLQGSGGATVASAAGSGLFGPALARFLETLRVAEAQIAAVRDRLAKGAPR